VFFVVEDRLRFVSVGIQWLELIFVCSGMFHIADNLNYKLTGITTVITDFNCQSAKLMFVRDTRNPRYGRVGLIISVIRPV